MRLSALFFVLPLAGCSGGEPPPVVAPPTVPADLLTPCAGYQGRTPETEGQLIEVLVAERAGRICANGKIATIGSIVSIQ